MTAFDAYSKYYDLLYRDKDYQGEAVYVSKRIRQHAPQTKSLLELGCGTGIHAKHLAGLGFHITGIDISESMLRTAEELRSALPATLSPKIRFILGDARTFRAHRTFDAVLSLFHVASYQITNKDIHALLSSASEHLLSGGLFLFDFWYGPAVLSEKPETRIKRLEDSHVQITRIAEPILDSTNNRVDVCYEILILDKATGRPHTIREIHKMRYFFIPEIEDLCSQHGLRPVLFEEWMTGRPPGDRTWGVTCLARKS